MKIKGTFATEFSGSVGGLTAAHNRGGYYLRNRVVPTDPATVTQVTRRNAMRTMVGRWMTTLTAANRASWELYAQNTPFTNDLGDPLILTGQQAFIGSALARAPVPLGSVAAGPGTFNRSEMGEITVTASAASDEYEVVYDNTRPWAVAVGGALVIYEGRPQNGSVNFYKGPFLHADDVLGAVVPPTSPATVTSAYNLVAGQAVFLRLVAVTADGRWTPGVVVRAVVGA